jgi:hypothetical protein
MSETEKNNSFANSLLVGIIAGFILPIIFFLLYYFFRFDNVEFIKYLSWLLESKKLVTVLSLSVAPNIFSFMFFVRRDKLYSGRGVLLATVLFGMFIFILKLI